MPRQGAYLAILTCLATTVLARCQWAGMQNAKDNYLDAQASGELSEFLSLPDTKYFENNREVDIRKGVLSKPLRIDHSRTIADQEGCAIYTELISADAASPYVIGTQMRFNNSDTGAITLASIDSVVTTTSDWLFNASRTLSVVQQEDWGVIDLSRQDTREYLQAAADAYLDLWGNPGAKVPWGNPCRRLEGSAYTGSGLPTDSCNVGIPGGNQPPVTNRRYVIDETVGSVNVLCSFGAMRNGAPDSHEFRIENGKLRYVHTMTVMRSMTANQFMG